MGRTATSDQYIARDYEDDAVFLRTGFGESKESYGGTHEQGLAG